MGKFAIKKQLLDIRGLFQFTRLIVIVMPGQGESPTCL